VTGLIEQPDRERFEIAGCDAGPEDDSPVFKRLRCAVDVHRPDPDTHPPQAGTPPPGAGAKCLICRGRPPGRRLACCLR
jgi:hypothetical protein